MVLFRGIKGFRLPLRKFKVTTYLQIAVLLFSHQSDGTFKTAPSVKAF